MAFRKISNGHNCANGHPIMTNSCLVLTSREGFSRSADRMAPLPDGSNPRWRLAAILESSIVYISAAGSGGTEEKIMSEDEE